MTTSIRIRVGLQEYQFEAASGVHVGAGDLLDPDTATRVIRQLSNPRELSQLRSLVIGGGRRSFEWDAELPRVLATLIRSGRLRVRRIQADSYRVLGSTPLLEAVADAVENQIVETHSVMIELLDADGNPVPGEPFRIKLPDGTVKTSSLDDQGKAHITGIETPGTCQVCFYKRDAAIWAAA
ncbi:Ig-like domain-containing protein [Enhygromyxa salina]|uniref:Uncharacterized protein n=1 Tax=Enhygromyxa salina TaxID=215803 RepID=A0A2S9Y2J3_9BACT|nr:Ig-like domain-containing protein [Enhygromyxa salina]PRP99332.1 hypothetical protein ENSA7_63740 [Enhygromyxa salina]